MAALLSRQNPLLFIPGFFQNDAEGTDPLQNSAREIFHKDKNKSKLRSDCSTRVKKRELIFKEIPQESSSRIFEARSDCPTRSKHKVGF